MSEEITDIHKLRKLQERYPFTEEELEILVRSHELLENTNDEDDFLMKLARASPYQFFFLPGNELRERVNWIEDNLLPPGFANQLRAAISVDAFVEYANQGQEKSLERFLEGVANTGRRGAKEALRFLFRLIDQPQPDEITDICVRLAIASDTLVTPVLDKEATLDKLDNMTSASDALARLLTGSCDEKPLNQQVFVTWAEENFPMLSSPLSTFIHGLLFHGHPYPKAQIAYVPPKLDTNTMIFEDPSSAPSLAALSFTSPQFGGKWHRIYSSFLDGRSFNRLEWSLLGYSGPTVLLVKTTAQAVLGAFASAPWKNARDFYGNADCFLFELEPKLIVHRPEGSGSNFMYLHSDRDPISDSCHGHAHGLGFGGDLDKPRLFIPETFEHCTADFLDKAFHNGELLPSEALERFEIQVLEVWGVGGDEVIAQALRHRSEHRERSDTAVLRARKVLDKSPFVEDLKSGLIINKVYKHQEQARGRHDFRVDDEHGGYKIDH